MDSRTTEGLVVIATVIAKAVYDVFGGKRRDRRHSHALDVRFGLLDVTLEQKFGEVRSAVAEVRAFCVGPDGRNGMRSQIEALDRRVTASESRERAELERRVGALDRRSSV